MLKEMLQNKMYSSPYRAKFGHDAILAPITALYASPVKMGYGCDGSKGAFILSAAAAF